MRTKITAEQTVEYLHQVKSVAFINLDQTMYALDVGGLLFQGERPPTRGSCFRSPTSYYLYDEDDFEESVKEGCA